MSSGLATQLQGWSRVIIVQVSGVPHTMPSSVSVQLPSSEHDSKASRQVLSSRSLRVLQLARYTLHSDAESQYPGNVVACSGGCRQWASRQQGEQAMG